MIFQADNWAWSLGSYICVLQLVLGISGSVYCEYLSWISCFPCKSNLV